MVTNSWTTATAVLRLATRLVDGIQAGMVERGFTDVRPAHGFAFSYLSAGPATTSQLAEHLGVTKQAGSELVQHLVARGYLLRQVDAGDRRARQLVLTERGHACTRAAEVAAAASVDHWREEVPAAQFEDLQRAIVILAGQGRLRPTW